MQCKLGRISMADLGTVGARVYMNAAGYVPGLVSMDASYIINTENNIYLTMAQPAEEEGIRV